MQTGEIGPLALNGMNGFQLFGEVIGIQGRLYKKAKQIVQHRCLGIGYAF